MGLVARGTNHGIRGLELSVPRPDLQGRERGWRLNRSPKDNDLINHASNNEATTKTQKDGVQKASGWVNASMCGRVACPKLQGTEAPVLGTLLDLALWISSGCSSVSFNILCNKPVTS